MSMSSRLRRTAGISLPAALASAAGCILCASVPGVAHAQTLLAEYKFNESGTTTAPNSAGTSAATLTMYNTSGTAIDSHGAGVAGTGSGDYAWDNTSATGTSGTETGGKLAGATASTVPTLLSSAFSEGTYTIQGWFKADTSSTFAGGSRVFDGTQFLLLATTNGANPVLQLQVNSNNTAQDAYSGTLPVLNSGSPQWVFWALTYSTTYTGSATGSALVQFYDGTTTTSVTTAGSSTALTGAVYTTAATTETIGNRGSYDRAFDGEMDDIRIYSGALTATQLEQLRTADISNAATPNLTAAASPEPASVALSLLGMLGIAAPSVRRFRRNRSRE